MLVGFPDCYFEFLAIPGTDSTAWKSMTLLVACFRINAAANQ